MSISRYDGARRGEYTIGELSRLYGIGTDAIRYYERKGILEPVRGENGYRYYSARSIWRMNVIRNLRSLDFPVERIRDYFQNRTARTTEELLREELALVEARMEELECLRSSVQGQLDTLDYVRQLPLETVRLRTLPCRRAFALYREHSLDEETDLLMKELAERSCGRIDVIGNSRMAAIISPEEGGAAFRGAMIFDDQGDTQLPEGDWLSVFYAGPTASREHLALLREHAARKGLKLREPFLEIIWQDIHTSDNPAEFISEVQAPVEREGRSAPGTEGAVPAPDRG